MPYLEEQMYCSQQIRVPPKFPFILKKYAKAAIKTQPYDLLRWSCEYFKCLSEGTEPPVKSRLEYPVFNTEGGLSRGYLRMLIRQLMYVQMVPRGYLRQKWCGACLDLEEFKRIMCLCQAHKAKELNKLKFFAVAAGLLTQSLTQTMILLCESLTQEPEGGSARIPVEDFIFMYTFLAALDCSRQWRYIDGIREDLYPLHEEVAEETIAETEVAPEDVSSPDFSARFKMTEDEEFEAKSESSSESEMSCLLFKDEFGEGKLEENVENEALNAFLLNRANRIEEMMTVLSELEAIVKLCNVLGYDLGMIAGRQMSVTSGEFVVDTIKKELLDKMGDIIETLPELPYRKRATPEEIEDITTIVDMFMDKAIEFIIPDEVYVEEEDIPEPQIFVVDAIPGIGPVVPADIQEKVVQYAKDVATKQADMFMPRNIRHFLCPPLEMFIDSLEMMCRQESEEREIASHLPENNAFGEACACDVGPVCKCGLPGCKCNAHRTCSCDDINCACDLHAECACGTDATVSVKASRPAVTQDLKKPSVAFYKSTQMMTPSQMATISEEKIGEGASPNAAKSKSVAWDKSKNVMPAKCEATYQLKDQSLGKSRSIVSDTTFTKSKSEPVEKSESTLSPKSKSEVIVRADTVQSKTDRSETDVDDKSEPDTSPEVVVVSAPRVAMPTPDTESVESENLAPASSAPQIEESEAAKADDDSEVSTAIASDKPDDDTSGDVDSNSKFSGKLISVGMNDSVDVTAQHEVEPLIEKSVSYNVGGARDTGAKDDPDGTNVKAESKGDDSDPKENNDLNNFDINTDRPIDDVAKPDSDDEKQQTDVTVKPDSDGEVYKSPINTTIFDTKSDVDEIVDKPDFSVEDAAVEATEGKKLEVVPASRFAE